MKNSEILFPATANVALISIHPLYADRILSGEKRWEFRRSWAKQPIDYLAIYSTSPVKRIVAVVEVGQEIRASKNKLWELSRDHGGGISRRKLYAYLEGKAEAIALELKNRLILHESIDPFEIFGDNFRAPQSFQYLSSDKWSLLRDKLSGKSWE